MKKSGRPGGCLVAIVIVIVIVVTIIARAPKSNSTLSSPAPSAETEPQDPNQKVAYGLEGQDPCAFKDAEELFNLGNAAKISDSDAHKMVDDFVSQIKGGKMPEDPSCRSLCIELEKAPGLSGVRQRLLEALHSAAERIGKPLWEMPGDAQNAFTNANGLYQKRRFDQSVQAYRALLAKYPSQLDARNNLGLGEMHAGHNLAALIQFDTILLVAPSYDGAKLNASVALTRLGLADQARSMAEEVAKQNPQSAMGHYNLGWQQNSRGEFDAAASSFRNALRLYPEYSKAGLANALNSFENLKKPLPEELGSLAEAERANLQGTDVSIITVNAPSDASLIDRVKAYFTVDRRLLSEKKGAQLAVYRVQDGVKSRIWLNESDSAAAEVAAYNPDAKVGLFDRAIPFPGTPAFWWPLLAVTLLIHILFTRRAFKNRERGAGTWGVLSTLLLAVCAGVFYPFAFPTVVALGWALIAASVVNATVLHARGKI